MNERKIGYPKMYTCMAKISEETNEIECWVPTSCYLLAVKTKFLNDGGSYTTYDVIYTKDSKTLKQISLPETKSDYQITEKESEEVSNDYDTIKNICMLRNEAILSRMDKSDPILWEQEKEIFLNKLVDYFANSYEGMQTPLQKIMSKTNQ